MTLARFAALFISVSTIVRCVFSFDPCQPFSAAQVTGKKFFDSSTGEYIPIKGITYYPRVNDGPINVNNVDLFTEEYRHVWERDIPYLKQLGVNAIRIYAVDPSKNHDGFMCALRSAGIRVIVGLAADCDDCSINSDESPACYPASLKTRGQFIIHAFAKYDNVLGFSAGNEINLANINFGGGFGATEWNAPCQKKFVRDMRAYIQGCGMRHIPVGVVVADWDREANAKYYNCRGDAEDELENVEWYGINIYRHCDGTATDISELGGLNSLRKNFKDYDMSIPVLLAEFGCINRSFPKEDGFEAQRTWLQVDAIFSEKYSKQFAGGMVFEYSVEDHHTSSKFPYDDYGIGNYGIGYLSPSDCNDAKNEEDVEFVPCNYVPKPEFGLLATKYDSVDTSHQPSLNTYDPGELPVPQCPPQFPPLSNFTWDADELEDFPCGPTSFTCPVPSECSEHPTSTPTRSPLPPSVPPTKSPTTVAPTARTKGPSKSPVTQAPTEALTTESPTKAPVAADVPTSTPSDVPESTSSPSDMPTTFEPTISHSPSRPYEPSASPSSSREPTDIPTAFPTTTPSLSPPTANPTSSPTTSPTSRLTTKLPSSFPSEAPTRVSSEVPSSVESNVPSEAPTKVSSEVPSSVGSSVPSESPSMSPTFTRTLSPSQAPVVIPVVQQNCTGICMGTYPFGCADNWEVPGTVLYGCHPNGGCFYANSTDADYPWEGFCTFKLINDTEPSSWPSIAPSRVASATPSAETLSPSQTPTAVPATQQDCTGVCIGTYPFGCADNWERGTVLYGCHPNGGCFYANSTDAKYPWDGFCTFKLVDLTSWPSTAPSTVAASSPTAAPLSPTDPVSLTDTSSSSGLSKARHALVAVCMGTVFHTFGG